MEYNLHQQDAAKSMVGLPGTVDKSSSMTKNHRNNMTTTEKSAYIDAELCLMSRPAQAGITGAQNRWDELDWAHITQSNVIHNVVRQTSSFALLNKRR